MFHSASNGHDRRQRIVGTRLPFASGPAGTSVLLWRSSVVEPEAARIAVVPDVFAVLRLTVYGRLQKVGTLM